MNNKLKDTSNDREYYTITPRLVWALSRDPYDYTLWGVIKDIAGEDGECYISTPELAKLAMMSVGKVQDCRKYLISAGLIEGKIERDSGYTQSVWHLRVSDIWAESVAWAKSHKSIKSRLEFKEELKRSLDESKHSPDVRGGSPDESGGTPGETKNIHKEQHEEYVASQTIKITPEQKAMSDEMKKDFDSMPSTPNKRMNAEQAREMIRNDLANLDKTMNVAVSDARLSKKQWVEMVSGWFAVVLEREKVSFDEMEANRAYEQIKLGNDNDTEKLRQFCKKMVGKFKPKKPTDNITARWVLNSFEQWKSSGYKESEVVKGDFSSWQIG